MSFKSLNQFIAYLKEEGELLVIKEFVDPVLHIAEITDRISKQKGGGKALLFENNGTGFPILINSLGSYKRICMALNVTDLEDIGSEIEKLFRIVTSAKNNLSSKLKLLPELNRLSSFFPKIVNGRGQCQEVVITNPDLAILPVLKCWPADGGRFITLPLVHTRDLLTSSRNVGMYRMQVFGRDITGMHWHKHKTGHKHFLDYQRSNSKMPVAVALGGDPVYTYSATAPLPENFDEYILAGFLRKQKVELVKCLTQDIEVPRDVDIVIEGFIDPGEELIIEGPFGDHTGFYSLPDFYPKFHVTCITHRKDAVYPATIVGIPPQEDAWIGKATERIFIKPLQIGVLPEIIDIDLPVAGVVHNLTIVKIDKKFSYQHLKVMNSLWGAGQMMFNKILLIVDGSIDIHNYHELAAYVIDAINPSNDVYISYGTLDVLDHSSSKMSAGGKMCINATKEKSGENPRIVSEFTCIQEIGSGDLKSEFKDIIEINGKLIASGINLMIISISKNRKNQVYDLAAEIFQREDLKFVKIAVFVDKEVDIFDLFMVTWLCCNNIEPGRDCKVIVVNNSEHLIIDGTRKSKIFDNFTRDWPNVIVSDDDTIRHVDDKWESLGIGERIESPSLRFRRLICSDGAVAEKNL